MWEDNKALQAAWKKRHKLHIDSLVLHKLIKKYKDEGNFKWIKGNFIYRKGNDSPILLFSHENYGNIVKDEATDLWIKSKECKQMRDKLRAEGDKIWDDAVRATCGKINYEFRTEKDGQYCILEDGSVFAPDEGGKQADAGGTE
ncbi:MAG: hypothetical protein C0404_14875 [Verrucomicrobia bacterium]|nr:hypothetical protein [Verrucomicrobiota bacterium]